MSPAVEETRPAADPSPRPHPVAAASARSDAVTTAVDSWLDARLRLAWGLVSLLFALVAVLVVVPAATSAGGVSPLDEFWYTDSLDKANRGELSNTGDKVDDYARQVMACRGVIGVTPPSSACGVPQADGSVPLNGYTAADIHAPTYFFLTAALGKVIRGIGITEDLLIAGRLAGALWLTLGMVALLALGRMWGAGWLVPGMTAVALAASPLVVSVSGYLTPDALGLLIGSGVLIATTLWQRGRLPVGLLFAAALVPAFVKVPFVLAPLFGAFLLLVAGLAGHTPWRRVVTGAAILIGGAGAGAILWQTIRGWLAVGVPAQHPDAPDPLAVSTFVRYIGYYLDVIPVVSGAPIPVTTTVGVAVLPLSWLLFAAALGGMLFRRRTDPLLPVCWAGLTGMVLGSVVLSLIVLVASGGFLIGTPRYGLALVPLFAIPLMCMRQSLVVVLLFVSIGASLVSYALLW